MKLCPTCGQPVAEEIAACPACGRELGDRRRTIDDYRIVDVLHEGHSTFLCRAVRERTQEHVMIRLFTPRSGVTAAVAARLERELEELKKLPGEGFVRHYAIRRSADGLWYRVSEWVDAESWGSLLASGRLADRSVLLGLFRRTAEILTVLHAHGHFIPHLILNDIIVVPEASGRALAVKIDYKLSRFIDPRLDRPAPMLRRLLASHPDIVNQRPLDFRSDIWSLGKVFVELLSGDLEIDDLEARVDDLEVPEDVKVLLRVMLADDPDLRPQSMAEIADSLARIQRAMESSVALPPPGPAAPPIGPIPGLQKRIRWLAAAVALLVAAGGLTWIYLAREGRDTEGLLEGYANRYASAVAFVLADYWIQVADGTKVYRNVAEGTAFLADREGYLLTSRHVVCPWLEDPRFAGAAQYLRQRDLEPVMGYRLYLWFEGTPAFNPSGRMIAGADISDVYFTENAYSTEGAPRVEISGVARPPRRTRQLVKSPLKDDFAVLKVDRLPPGVAPLPLDQAMEPRKLPKLSRVIALGFPLGSRTQVDTVNASVVRGNVRRAFENMFQIDASLHGGNSGGPVIDARGRVIGIVSAVAMDFSQGLLPIGTPVWDIGLILPVTGALQLLNDFKAGHAKWNGTIDFSIDASLARIRDTAARGRWADAMAAADETLGRHPQPAMVAAAGMLHFCNADYPGARQRFTQSLSMDPEDDQARLMLTLIDWLTGSRNEHPYHRHLAAADWRSPAEFQGFLLQVLEGRVELPEALNAWTGSSERSWLHYIAGLMRLREERTEAAERLIEQAVLAADPDAWEFLLARARLDEIRRRRGAALTASEPSNAYAAQLQHFDRTLQASLDARKRRQESLAPLLANLAREDITLDDRRADLKKLIELDPENRTAEGALAYASAAADDFPEALDRLRAYLLAAGRPTAMRLGLGLLEAGILHYQGRQAEADECLAEYARRTRDPWFLAVCDYLRGRQPENALRQLAGEAPELILTGFAAAGFWAESSGDKPRAIRFYREALGTFLDNWIEFDFVRERANRLRRSAD
jgi:S1-C subfamily serine protease